MDENVNGEMVVAEVQEAQTASLNVTLAGEQGTLPDPVPFNITLRAAIALAQEAIRGGGIPGIDANAADDFENFELSRYPEKDGLPNRLVLRPKTEYGS